ncbi:uncharacterized protein LOC132402599 [Hypanus sabinus]|uniref:uncharacterized protein LOC132402599 n=1 Tax=Hypanus sabinus TaxID=79690 RepID=UPI0028C4EA3E|nr:uncharacterized protein LOC132402599 [Hypanus sabinus]
MAADGPQALAKVSSMAMLDAAEDARKDLELIMKPYANWEEFLTPGPLSIAVLGELIFISAAEAFQVKLGTVGGSSRSLRQPDSFHACLMQVSDQGWKAFQQAHKKMDQIRLYTMTAPKHLASAVQVLARPPSVVKAMLPSRLNSLRKVAEQCQGLAASVEGEFASLMDLVQELLELCAASRTECHRQAKEVGQALEEARARKVAAERDKGRLEAQFVEACAGMEETRALYRKAVRAIPSGKNLVGVYVTQSLLDLTSSLATELVAAGLTEPVGLALEITDVATQHFKKKLQNKKAEAKGDGGPGSSVGLCLRAMEMVMGSALLQDLVSDGGTLDPEKLGTTPSDSGAMFQSSMDQLKQEKEGDTRNAGLELCQVGIDLCQRLEQLGQAEKPSEAQLRDLASSLQEQNTKVQAYLLDVKKSIKAPAIAPQPPNLSSAAGEEKVEQLQEGLSKMVLEQACFRVEQAKCQLDISRENYQKVAESKEKVTKELDEVLLTMKRCQVKEIDYDTTLKLLVTGLGALSQVKAQWAKMTNFFQMMSNLIQVSLNDAVTQFASDSEGCELIPGYTQDAFVKDMIYTEAFQACSVASLCHLIASTYVDVSAKHLMDQVTSLEAYISLSPSDPLFNVERTKFQEGYTVAQEAVRQLVLKNKEEFEAQIQQRIDRINSTLQEVTPLAMKQ